jgi:hypothetical protein
MGSFQRINPLGAGAFVRGPARLLIEPVTGPYPSRIADVIKLDTVGQASEVQSISITGTPTGGTFTLSFQGNTTSNIAYNATAAAVAAAFQALPNVGVTGATTTGGPLPATPVVLTFAGNLANTGLPLITATSTGLTGGTTPAVVVTRTTPGLGQYDPIGQWVELGSTKTGVAIERTNTEEVFDVDQVLGTIATQATDWQLAVQTALAEVTLENIQLCWEGGAITTDVTNQERHLAMGNPQYYTQKRLAVLNQSAAGKIRAHVMRIVQREPQNSSFLYDKTGPQQTIPQRFRALPDPTIQDPLARFGEIIEML